MNHAREWVGVNIGGQPGQVLRAPIFRILALGMTAASAVQPRLSISNPKTQHGHLYTSVFDDFPKLLPTNSMFDKLLIGLGFVVKIYRWPPYESPLIWDATECVRTPHINRHLQQIRVSLSSVILSILLFGAPSSWPWISLSDHAGGRVNADAGCRRKYINPLDRNM